MSEQPEIPLRRRLTALEAALRNATLLGDDLPPHVLADLAGQVAALAAIGEFRRDASSRGTGAAAGTPLPPEEAQVCLGLLQQVRHAHDQLACRLRQQQAETAERLAKLRLGKRTLNAYKNA